jgi:hypothetical protein
VSTICLCVFLMVFCCVPSFMLRFRSLCAMCIHVYNWHRRTYWYRWVMLAALSFIVLLNSVLWVTFVPVTPQVCPCACLFFDWIWLSVPVCRSLVWFCIHTYARTYVHLRSTCSCTQYTHTALYTLTFHLRIHYMATPTTCTHIHTHIHIHIHTHSHNTGKDLLRHE